MPALLFLVDGFLKTHSKGRPLRPDLRVWENYGTSLLACLGFLKGFSVKLLPESNLNGESKNKEYTGDTYFDLSHILCPLLNPPQSRF
jgi:hypothetical protein